MTSVFPGHFTNESDFSIKPSYSYGIYTDIDFNSEKSLIIAPTEQLLLEYLPSILHRINSYVFLKVWRENKTSLLGEKLSKDELPHDNLQSYIISSLEHWRIEGLITS